MKKYIILMLLVGASSGLLAMDQKQAHAQSKKEQSQREADKREIRRAVQRGLDQRTQASRQAANPYGRPVETPARPTKRSIFNQLQDDYNDPVALELEAKANPQKVATDVAEGLKKEIADFCERANLEKQ